MCLISTTLTPLPLLLLLLLAIRLLGCHRWHGKTEKADASKLEQRREDHNKTGYEEDIDAFEIRDLGQRSVGTGQDRHHGEHGGDAESAACRRCVAGQPERDPRQDNDETRRHVDVDDVVAETAHEVELTGQTGIIAYHAQQQPIDYSHCYGYVIHARLI